MPKSVSLAESCRLADSAFPAVFAALVARGARVRINGGRAGTLITSGLPGVNPNVLSNYGGRSSSEWLCAKVLQSLDEDPAVYDDLRALPADRRDHYTPRGSGQVGESASIALTLPPGGIWHYAFRLGLATYDAAEGQPITYADRSIRAVQDWRRFPVTGISAFDAERYAAWLAETGRIPGARLCSDLEWERAARGADGRAYPHGDRLLPDDANFDMTYGKKARAMGLDVIGSHPATRSPVGAEDMIGNAYERVRSSFAKGRRRSAAPS